MTDHRNILALIDPGAGANPNAAVSKAIQSATSTGTVQSAAPTNAPGNINSSTLNFTPDSNYTFFQDYPVVNQNIALPGPVQGNTSTT